MITIDEKIKHKVYKCDICGNTQKYFDNDKGFTLRHKHNGSIYLPWFWRNIDNIHHACSPDCVKKIDPLNELDKYAQDSNWRLVY
jgi:hypothetical protein